MYVYFLNCCKGTDDCGTGNLQSASTLKVFDLLQRKNYITSRDLLYLQVILAVLGKHSLIDKVYQYAQNNEDVLHFDPPLRCIGMLFLFYLWY